MAQHLTASAMALVKPFSYLNQDIDIHNYSMLDRLARPNIGQRGLL